MSIAEMTIELAELTTDEVLARVLGNADLRDVHRELVAAWDGAWQTVEPTLLELCRLCVAQSLRCSFELATRTPLAHDAGFDEQKAAALPNWRTSDVYSPTERACLGYVEQFVFDVASLDDAMSAQVCEHLGDQGLADFVNALLVVEQRQRLRLIWEQIFQEEK